MIDRKLTAIFFIPEAGITPFMRALCIVGAALEKAAHKVYYIRCTGEMIRCPMLGMHRLSPNASSEEKRKICAICLKNAGIAERRYKFTFLPLREIISPDVLQTIDGLGVNTTDRLDEIQYDGFAVGKVAQYDFGLEKKQIYEPGMDAESHDLFLAYIRNTALSVAIGNELQRQYSPDLFVTFNQYAQCDGIRYVAQKHGILNYNCTYPSYLGFDGSSIYISKYRFLVSENRRSQDWHMFRNIPIQRKHVLASWDDAIFRNYQQGSHIYSISKGTNPQSVFESLKLDSKRKTFVAFTSSQDEIVGGEIVLKVWGEDPGRRYAFPNQIAWIQMLKEFSDARDDIQIVVRIHPREGINKNYSFGSKHLEKLRAAFVAPTDKFKIVWPDDKISSYDLFEIASGVLIAWSTVGLEAARIGIPVLCYTHNMCYPDDDFIMVASTADEYRKKLEKLIAMEYSIEHLLRAVRFNFIRTFMQSLDLSETVLNDPFDNRWPNPPKKMVQTLASILTDNIDLVEYNKKVWLESLPPDAAVLEREALCYGIRLFIDSTYCPPKIQSNPESNRSLFARIHRKVKSLVQETGLLAANKKTASSMFVDYTLKFSQNVKEIDKCRLQTMRDKKLRVLVGRDDGQTWYILNGRVIERYSPLCLKLAKLAVELQSL